MWLLDSDATLHQDQLPATEVSGDDGAFTPADPDVPLAIRFDGTQDGRGFSTARRLRLRGHRGRLVAVGPLEPDQARHAFQCGFDAVGIEAAALERHGRAAWEDALRVSVTDQYLSDPTSRSAALGSGLGATPARPEPIPA